MKMDDNRKHPLWSSRRLPFQMVLVVLLTLLVPRPQRIAAQTSDAPSNPLPDERRRVASIIRNGTPDSVVVSLTSEMPQQWNQASGMACYGLAPYESRSAGTFFIAPAKPYEQLSEILMKGTTAHGLVGTVQMRVKVRPWTLLQ